MLDAEDYCSCFPINVRFLFILFSTSHEEPQITWLADAGSEQRRELNLPLPDLSNRREKKPAKEEKKNPQRFKRAGRADETPSRRAITSHRRRPLIHLGRGDIQQEAQMRRETPPRFSL